MLHPSMAAAVTHMLEDGLHPGYLTMVMEPGL